MNFCVSLIAGLTLFGSNLQQPRQRLDFSTPTSFPRSATIVKGTILEFTGPIRIDANLTFFIRVNGREVARGIFAKEWFLTWDTSSETSSGCEVAIAWYQRPGEVNNMARFSLKIIDKSPYKISEPTMSGDGNADITIFGIDVLKADRFELLVDGIRTGIFVGPTGKRAVPLDNLRPGRRKLGAIAYLPGGMTLDVEPTTLNIESRIKLLPLPENGNLDLTASPSTITIPVKFDAPSTLKITRTELLVNGDVVAKYEGKPDVMTLSLDPLESGEHLVYVMVYGFSGPGTQSTDQVLKITRKPEQDRARRIYSWYRNLIRGFASVSDLVWQAEIDEGNIGSVPGSRNQAIASWALVSNYLMQQSAFVRNSPDPFPTDSSFSLTLKHIRDHIAKGYEGLAYATNAIANSLRMRYDSAGGRELSEREADSVIALFAESNRRCDEADTETSNGRKLIETICQKSGWDVRPPVVEGFGLLSDLLAKKSHRILQESTLIKWFSKQQKIIDWFDAGIEKLSRLLRSCSDKEAKELILFLKAESEKMSSQFRSEVPPSYIDEKYRIVLTDALGTLGECWRVRCSIIALAIFYPGSLPGKPSRIEYRNQPDRDSMKNVITLRIEAIERLNSIGKRYNLPEFKFGRSWSEELPGPPDN